MNSEAKAMSNEQLHEAMVALHEKVEEGRAGDFYGYQEGDYQQIEDKAYELYKLGRHDKALVLVEGLIELNRFRPYPHRLRGQVLLERGQVAEALGCFEAADEHGPGNPTTLSKLGESYMRLGEPGEAVSYFERVLEDEEVGEEHAARLRSQVLLKVARRLLGEETGQV